MTLDEKSKNDWTIDKCHKKTAKENFLRGKTLLHLRNAFS